MRIVRFQWKTVFLLFLLSQSQILRAQSNVTAKIKFLSDTIALGYPTPLLMSISHPKNQIIAFPDSAKDFLPWELKSKEVFTTITSDRVSVDSVKYYVITWEVDSIQHFQLPYYVISGKDTNKLMSNFDSVIFRPRIPNDPQKIKDLSVKNVDYYAPISDKLNWFAISIVIVLFLTLMFLTLVYMNKPMKKWWIKYNLKKEFGKVKKSLEILDKKQLSEIAYLNEMNKIWKNYLSSVWNQNFRALTTAEMSEYFQESSALSNDEVHVINRMNSFSDIGNYVGAQLSMSEVKELKTSTIKILKSAFAQKIENAIETKFPKK